MDNPSETLDMTQGTGGSGNTRLTIGIPTYNRSAKLQRTIGLLVAELARIETCPEEVEILVGDNCSTDGTPAVLRGAADAHVQLRFYRLPNNIGVDGNVQELYERAHGNYLWIFADDDLPFPGAIGRVLTALRTHQPAVLLFSFVQPASSTNRPFNFPEDPHIVQDPREAVELLFRYPKISAYVLRRCDLGPVDEMSHAPAIGSDYAYVGLALSVLERFKGKGLCVISEALAGSDDEYLSIRFGPNTWGGLWRCACHPFVVRHSPETLFRERERAFLSRLSFLWAWQSGVLKVSPELEQQYRTAVREIQADWAALCSQPSVVPRFLLLKTGYSLLPRLSRQAAGVLRRSLAEAKGIYNWARGVRRYSAPGGRLGGHREPAK
jgi:glycosyltransferase involved in cell wall biosynthesis